MQLIQDLAALTHQAGDLKAHLCILGGEGGRKARRAAVVDVVCQELHGIVQRCAPFHDLPEYIQAALLIHLNGVAYQHNGNDNEYQQQYDDGHSKDAAE